MLEHTAKLNTEEAQEAINQDKTHTAMIWEDGEITYTKNGDLFGHRSLHQALEPWADEPLFEVPDNTLNPFSGDHECRIITDREALNEAIKEKLKDRDIKPRGYERL